MKINFHDIEVVTAIVVNAVLRLLCKITTYRIQNSKRGGDNSDM